MAKDACIDRGNYIRVERGERNSSIWLFGNITSALIIKVWWTYVNSKDMCKTIAIINSDIEFSKFGW